MDASMPVQTRTTCPYCGVGCGVLVTARPDGSCQVTGDAEHPANFGRLCSKGTALAETLSLDDRLLTPRIDGKDADWETALARVASTFSETIAAHGPDAVALYVSGQILTEDYYVANKFMKGFVGSANIDTNSRLCMASSVAGHRRAFGTDTVPGTYRDLEDADLVVLVGANLAWCHPVLFQRLLAVRKRRRQKLVVIDPRRTSSAEYADLHLALKPGSDVALFLGLLAHLEGANLCDKPYVSAHVTGAEAALGEARGWTVERVAAETGLKPADVAAFYYLVAATGKTVTVYSQGVNQSSAGTDKVNAIVNTHLFTGRIGRPGMGPFSVTGQPNAMGGREVGGLANMLAAHMDIENAGHRDLVQRFWQSPAIAERPGLKAVDLFRAVADGRVKALWIMATNPVDSLPEADLVRAALEACPFVVVSDVTAATDTAAFADVLLPAAAWGEKDGTVTNSERMVSRQRGFRRLPGAVRYDWEAIAEVARRMGFAGFNYAGPDAIYREYAALTAFENEGRRDLDIGAHARLAKAGYDAMEPYQWPLPAAGATAEDGDKRFFAEGGFYTPDRRGRMLPISYRKPASLPDAERPFVVNTGRVRDQWHTMTRTGTSPRLTAHYGEPFVEIHPDDARAAGIAPATVARLDGAHGAVLLRALVTERQQPGSLFVPMHWTDQVASNARIGAIIPGNTDPVSGQPESKHGTAALSAFPAAWYGFVVAVARPAVAGIAYWAAAPVAGGIKVELAGQAPPSDWLAFASELLDPAGAGAPDATLLRYSDAARGRERFALFDGSGALAALVFVAPEPVALSRGWAAKQLGTVPDVRGRASLLAGVGASTQDDPGAILCSCMNVGVNQIAAAIAGGARTVEAIGATTGAGTNCGSCRAEIGRLLAASEEDRPAAAEAPALVA